MDTNQCLRCKGGRNLCGLGRCPVLEKARRVMPKVEFASDHVFGASPPSVFVGRHNYPRVLAGPMLPTGEHDDPHSLDMSSGWYNRPIEEVVALSSSLMRPVKPLHVNKPFANERFLEVTHSLAMASKPVETEVFFERVPGHRKGLFDFTNVPMGPSMLAKKAELTENPSIPRAVDALVSDTDAKSVTAIKELTVRKVDEHAIQKILSVGLLGNKKRRKMVPTRWAITAVDDIISKAMVPKVLSFQEVGEYQLYTANYHGNYFHILFIPGVWGFEMKEVWLSGAMWTGDQGVEHGEKVSPYAGLGDYESFKGRKSYASNVTGAYYSARLGVLEKLTKMQRQASVMVYREITDEYWAPLGVWVIREAVRDAMKQKPRTFDTLQNALNTIHSEVRIKKWHKNSRLLEERKKQKRLEDFL